MPGLLVQSFLIGAISVYMLPYGWGWVESVLFGAILSATDPVAVVALLKELGVLPDLRVLIEAESLLNDGTAIVLFQLCLKILLEPDTSVASPPPHSLPPSLSASSTHHARCNAFVGAARSIAASSQCAVP
eukprot:486511-Rhodomonas_salina.1